MNEPRSRRDVILLSVGIAAAMFGEQVSGQGQQGQNVLRLPLTNVSAIELIGNRGQSVRITPDEIFAALKR